MTTTPHQLFDDSLRVEIESPSPDVSEGKSLAWSPLSLLNVS